ncbi:transmembrane protein 94-like isoform X2 [Corticium candelabrum]|nr:transmembrane protein 94-like isoform X2 [Corticium candelabrum]
MPSCSSLSFIPTFRDGRLVNLPVCLLVEDDEVLMPPGTQVPVNMSQIDGGDGDGLVELNRGDIYSPVSDKEAKESEVIEHSHIASWSRFQVKESAVSHIVRHSLAMSLNRPSSVLVQEKHKFTIQLLSHKLIWIFLGVSIFFSVLRLALLPDDVADWPEMIYILQIYTVMPLLPLSFPLLWTALKLYGTARVLTSFNYSRSRPETVLGETVPPDFTPPDPSQTVNSENENYKHVWQTFWELVKGHPNCLSRSANLLEGLGNVSVLSCSDKEGVLCNPSPYPNKVFFFCSEDSNETCSAQNTDGNQPNDNDEDQGKSETADGSHASLKAHRVSWHGLKDDINVIDSLYKQLDSSSNEASRVEDLTYAAKKLPPAGIIQLPSNSLISDESWLSRDELTEFMTSRSPSLFDGQYSPGSDVHVQILDFSVVSQGCSVKFDEPTWPRFLQSLKPLGLNVLLNNASQSPYAALWRQSHLCSLTTGQNNSDALERYLFALGHEIGFTSGGLSVFQLVSSISVFATATSWDLLQPSSRIVKGDETVRNRRWCAPKWHLNKHKSSIAAIPAAQVMVSQIVKQVDSGMYQLLSRGPADLLLDQCVDYWDGSELKPLTTQRRKRVMDFYRRFILSGYCVALAYRPLDDIQPLVTVNSDVYITVPHSYFDETFESSESLEVFSLSGTSHGETEGVLDEVGTGFMEKGPVQCVNVNPESCFRLQKGQVFIGMVSLQYQPKRDIVRLVEDLDGAGIRFVHFSSDSELTSKVFAAKMGLETGWNCHISLAEDRDQKQEPDSDGDECSSGSTSSRVDEMEELSEDTDFDTVFMNYKARLPRGIKQIRPHLENVDNVPLQVSLFTDCKPHATREMIEILQENGEVVCCIGSALNVENVPIFAQANVSFGLEPVYPLQYSKSGSCLDGDDNDVLNNAYASLRQGNDCRGMFRHLPVWLACDLNSLPCSLVFHREDNIRLTSLVHEARHITLSLRLCFLFLLSCLLTLSIVMILSSLFFLPPPLSGIHIIWLSLVIAPFLTVPILAKSPDKKLMVSLTAKNKEHIKDLRRFATYYMIRFVPLAVIAVLCFGLTLAQFCDHIRKNAFMNVSNYSCHSLLGMRHFTSSWNGWGLKFVQSLALGQDVISFFFAFQFAFASLTFMERNQPLWKMKPVDYKYWVICAAISLLLQILYFSVSSWAWSDAGLTDMFTAKLSDVPIAVYVIGLLCPLPSLAVHELTKHHDRKHYIRYQKRRKLEFQTKLGMNSPV